MSSPAPKKGKGRAAYKDGGASTKKGKPVNPASEYTLQSARGGAPDYYEVPGQLALGSVTPMQLPSYLRSAAEAGPASQDAELLSGMQSTMGQETVQVMSGRFDAVDGSRASRKSSDSKGSEGQRKGSKGSRSGSKNKNASKAERKASKGGGGSGSFEAPAGASKDAGFSAGGQSDIRASGAAKKTRDCCCGF
mmetsp:Transcript_10616/g.25940  ORF Transcript_10616/g.25940 Transcript_10616/m.25940 type:complete len:193 (+) Transcript_10616:213-791(+)|eukprot:g1309.t1